MGLFDFDIRDTAEERSVLHDISADNGKTWTKQWLTPTEVLEHRLNGYVTRPHNVESERTIKLFPGMAAKPIRITLEIPLDRDQEEYIDEYLDGLLSSFVRYNCEWEFM